MEFLGGEHHDEDDDKHDERHEGTIVPVRRGEGEVDGVSKEHDLTFGESVGDDIRGDSRHEDHHAGRDDARHCLRDDSLGESLEIVASQVSCSLNLAFVQLEQSRVQRKDSKRNIVDNHTDHCAEKRMFASTGSHASENQGEQVS